MDNAILAPYAKYQRFVDKVIEHEADISADRSTIHVELWFGAGGTGKSTAARELYPDAYWKDQTKWWPGYTGQTTLVWDEFSGCCATPTEFNSICDKGKHTIEIKGGFSTLNTTTIIIISNYHPHTWWGEKTRVCFTALERRFNLIRHFKQIGSESTKFTDFTEFSNSLVNIPSI